MDKELSNFQVWTKLFYEKILFRGEALQNVEFSFLMEKFFEMTWIFFLSFQIIVNKKKKKHLQEPRMKFFPRKYLRLETNQ